MRPDDITLTGGLERARAGDAQRVGAITADAFRYDPFNLWMFGAFAGIANLFHLQARRIYVPRGYCYTAGDEGACMWMLPGGDAGFSLADYAAFVFPTLWHCGPRAVRRGIRTGAAMDSRHPDFPHAYLFSIGVRETARGKGLGARSSNPCSTRATGRACPLISRIRTRQTPGSIPPAGLRRSAIRSTPSRVLPRWCRWFVSPAAASNGATGSRPRTGADGTVAMLVLVARTAGARRIAADFHVGIGIFARRAARPHGCT
jgi:hypothetical protein